MKQLALVSLLLSAVLAVSAQDSTTKKKKDWSKVSLANQPKDHFVFQLGYLNWTQAPDTANTSGLPRSVNVYFMMQFPFKTDPRLSVALGAGIAADNQYFKKTSIDIAGKVKNELDFTDRTDSNHFKKYKMTTAYLEAPLELRFTQSPETPNKSLKLAVGIKVGTLLSASVKGKNWVSPTGSLINGYTQKERSKKFINGTRFSITGRVGYGIMSFFASYQINSFVKDGFGPDIRPMTVGVMVSGL
jgi:hypothetical protein